MSSYETRIAINLGFDPRMALDRRLWNSTITKQYAPPWPCPECESGRLALRKNTLHSTQTAEFRRKRYGDDFNPLDDGLTFSAMLECVKCKETISCSGRGFFDIVDFSDEDGNSIQEHEENFVPEYFYPQLVLFKLRKVPEVVRHQLMCSFKVFFCDLGAAANHIRSAIDEILTERKISKVTQNGSRRPLDQRIDEFGAMDCANAEFARALKWIGNYGSHPEDLTKDDVFDAYEIIELLIEDIYIGHRRAIQKKVSEINSRKGPLSQKTAVETRHSP